MRRRAANALDWENLADEIEDMGWSQLRAVESHLVQALLHDLKATAWPGSREVPHWRAEARVQRGDARASFTPSMAQRIDIAALYRRALRGLPTTIDERAPRPVPETCQVTLDDMLKQDR